MRLTPPSGARWTGLRKVGGGKAAGEAQHQYAKHWPVQVKTQGFAVGGLTRRGSGDRRPRGASPEPWKSGGGLRPAGPCVAGLLRSRASQGSRHCVAPGARATRSPGAVGGVPAPPSVPPRHPRLSRKRAIANHRAFGHRRKAQVRSAPLGQVRNCPRRLPPCSPVCA